MSDLVTQLRGWLDEDVPIGVIMNEAAARIEQLEGQHKGLVLQNALLRQRPDLPVDRIPAAAEVRALIARIEQLEAALRDIADGMGETDLAEVGRYARHIARAALGERT